MSTFSGGTKKDELGHLDFVERIEKILQISQKRPQRRMYGKAPGATWRRNDLVENLEEKKDQHGPLVRSQKSLPRHIFFDHDKTNGPHNWGNGTMSCGDSQRLLWQVGSDS
jgi:hypothetical protein